MVVQSAIGVATATLGGGVQEASLAVTTEVLASSTAEVVRETWEESVETFRCLIGNTLCCGNRATLGQFIGIWRKGGDCRKIIEDALRIMAQAVRAGRYSDLTPDRRRLIASLATDRVTVEHWEYLDSTQKDQLAWNTSDLGKWWRGSRNRAMPWPDHLLADEAEMHQSMRIYL